MREKWYDSSEKVGATSVLEGVVLRNPLNLTFLLYYFHIRTILIPNEKAVQVFAKTACNCRLNTVTIMLLYSYGMNMLNLKR